MPTPNEHIVMDERLFAHINNDPFLSGSCNLEGQPFQRTIGYLNQYLDQLPQTDIPEDVKLLSNASNGLVKYQTDIDSIRASGPDKSLGLLTELAKKIHDDIKHLKGEEYLLVPGGWAAPDGGHAIIYQYSLDKEGNLLFSINNSGSGLLFHEKKSDKEKDLYNPVLTYTIPKDNISAKNLARFIQETIKAQTPKLHKMDKIDADYLYNRVFSLLAYVKGEISMSKTIAPNHWYTGGQLSGTCAQRSLHQMLKTRFVSLDEYRRFIYGFKMHALEEYLAQSGVLNDSERHDLIEQAIKHNVRLLNLEKTEQLGQSLFSQNEKKTGQEKLLGYLSQLNQKKPLPIKPIATVSNKSTPSTTHTLRLITPAIATVDTAIGKRCDDDVTLPIVLTTDQTVLAHMDAVLNRCSDLGVTQDQALLEQLESFFLNLPLPDKTIADPLDKVYSVIDSDIKATAFYQKMNQLQMIYFDTCQRLIGKNVVLPRMYLVKMSAFSVIGHVNANWPMTADKKCYHDFLKGMLDRFSTRADLALIANNDPQRDARYKHICALHSQYSGYNETDSDRVIWYYRSLLDNATKDTKVKTELEKKYLAQYGQDNSKLHVTLRSNQCTALYYFLEHEDELKSDAKFKPLIDKFQLQLDMEKAYTYGTPGLLSETYSSSYREISKIQLDLSNGPSGLWVEESPAKTNFHFMGINQALRENKYSWKTSSVASAQYWDTNTTKRSCNNIQLLPGVFAEKLNSFSITPEDKSSLAQHQVNSSDLEERELFHLRRDAASQIRLTLDYFNEHVEKCVDLNLQGYVEANLFQPGLLLAELSPKQAPAFLKQFDAFINNGLDLYEKKNQLSQASLFFIHLAYQVNQYAALHDPARLGGRLEAFYQHVNRCLETTDDPSIKASLHQYRFLTATAQMNLNLQNTAHLDDALFSYFQLQVTKNPEEQLDTDTQFQLQCARHNMVRFLSKHQTHITPQHIQTILAQLGISLKEPVHWSGKYPVYTVLSNDNVTCTVDIEQGKVFKSGMAYSNIPLDILGHPVIKQLGLQGLNSCFVSPDGRTFVMDNPPIALRFIKYQSQYHIQKKWIDRTGKESWFELAALTEAQQQELQLQPEALLKAGNGFWDASLKLAKTIKERDSLAWVHCEQKELLITDANHQPWYRGIPSYDTNWHDANWQLMDVQEHTTLCAQDTWIHQRLSAFESPDFITVAQKGSNYIAKLARYGLDYSVNGTSNTIHMDWEGSQYNLQDKLTSDWGEGISHLALSNDKQDICVLPVQQYINTNQRDTKSAYYRLTQDIQAKIPHHMVEQLIGKDKKAYEEKKPQLWQYTGTEKCLVLKMNQGAPVPQNSAEALYLCYVYLGNNQPDKAWAVLEDCDKRLGGLAGTYDEVRYLSWIINALPRQVERDEKNAVISNPPFVACQLKALALLADFSRQDKAIRFPEPTQDKLTVNGLYERETINEVKTFYSTVNAKIYALYTRMQAMRREMPINFTLSQVECKQLLDFYHQQLPEIEGKPRATGAMGYEWVQLHLMSLRREHTDLVAKELTGTATAFDKKRKHHIDEFIEHHDGVANVRSDLEYRAIDLYLPNNVTLNMSILPHQLLDTTLNRGVFSALVTNDNHQTIAIDDLVLNISEDVFIRHFNDYLLIATTENNVHRQRLLAFCQDTLIAHRHVSLDQQVSNVPLLCNVLYRVLSSGQPLPQDVVGSWGSYDGLLRYACTLSAPDIVIPQLIDTTKELLTTTTALWESIPEPSSTIIPAVLSAELKIIPFKESLPDSLKGISQQWHKVEMQFRQGDHTKTQLDQEATLLNSEEYVVGEVKYQALVNLKSIAKMLNDPIIKQLIPQTKKTLAALATEQEALEKAILTLAEQGTEEPALKQKWQIALDAGKRSPLDMTQLLILYFYQDTTHYKTETGLSDSSIQRLHTLLANYVDQGLRIQQHQRVQTQLEQLDKAKTKTPADQDRVKFLLAQTLFTENLVNAVDDPVLSLFQLNGTVLLRPQQKEALERLLKTPSDNNYSNVIEKIIMGGGKSKVILPTLAKKKATGHNLVVIEVPPALLRTNFIDLKSTSNALFNQTAYTFEFTRDSNCSATRLEQLYDQLTDVMVNKNYLVTTGDALQSLELKYLELLLSPPAPDRNDAKEATTAWENQVLWADKLVSLFKNRADLMIDEVHQGLLLKNKLNFTVGESGYVPRFIVQNSIDLYQFFKHINLDSNITLDDVLKNNALLVNAQQFELACQQLAHELVYHEKSPLKMYIETIGGKDSPSAAELFMYLQNKGPRTPDCVLTASEDVKDRLAFYKEQVSHFLPYTLNRNHGEHYGPSKSMDHSPETRALAIPYSANNVPNERSRFESCIETTNYTIQSMLLTGVDRALIRSVLEAWQIQARKELYDKASGTLDDMPIAHSFRMRTKGLEIPLSQLDLNDEEQLTRLHQHLQFDEQTIYELLKTNVLKHIRTDTSILHSDAYNHVDLVRSCQGMSGTPWNHSTFHQTLYYDSEVAKGTDGLVYSGIRAKTPTVRGIDFKDTDQFVTDLLKHSKASDQIRTIIDISATFKGVDNETVAKSLVQYINKHSNQFNTPNALQYVLYFNTNNELSALRIEKDIASQTPVVIGPSDPDSIKNRLGCEPGACFSYYDQSHVVGVDIKQADQARGLVLVDNDTTLDNFLQGSMRMRGLIEGEQRIDIVVPNRLATQSIEQWVEKMGNNQLRQLQQDNYETARSRMTNLVRHDLMHRLLDIQGDDAANQKAQMLTLFKRYFVETQTDDFFSQYGGISQERDTRELLESLQHQLRVHWTTLLSTAKQVPLEDELRIMASNMGDVVHEACKPGVCALKQMSSNALNTQVEVQKEVQVQILVEKNVLKEKYDLLRKEEKYQAWDLLTVKPSNSDVLCFKTLTDICNTTGAKNIPAFSDQIKASKNFYQSYQGQEKYVGMFLKPVHALLFNRVGNKLMCTVLTQEESQQLQPWIKTQDQRACWISTTHHTELAGKIPEDVRHRTDYLDVIEQVRYFNGEFNALLQKDATLSWLDHESSEKLDFYEQYLSPCRETLPTHINQLRLIFSVNRQIYQFISQNPAVNRDQFDWKSKFPDCRESDIEDYRAVANAFNDITALRDNKDIVTKRWNCPAASMGYIDQYIKKITATIGTNHKRLSDIVKKITANENFKTIANSMLETPFKLIAPENMKPNTMDLPGLYSSINELRIRALEFLDKTELKAKYNEPSKATFSLYVLLKEATTNYVDDKINLEEFKRVLAESTNQYKLLLEPTLGVKDSVLNMTNIALLGTNKILGTRFSEFKTKAQALKIANDISKHILPANRKNQI